MGSGMFAQPNFPRSVNMGGLSMLGGGGGSGATTANEYGLYGSLTSQSPLSTAGGSYSNFGTNLIGVPTNATVTMSRRVDCSEGGVAKAKQGLDYMTLMITHTDDLDTYKQQRALSVYHTLLHDKASTMKSVGAMNAWLKSDAGRRRFGGQVSSKALEEWATPDSVLMTELNTPNIDDGIASELTVTTAVQGRVRIPNIFLAGAKTKPGVGNYFYLVLQRCRLESSKKIRSTSINPLEDVEIDDNNNMGLEKKGPAGKEVKRQESSSAMDEEGDDNSFFSSSSSSGRKPAPDYYWRYIPTFCHHGCTPPPCLWFHEGVSEGRYYYIGYHSVPHERDYDLQAQSALAQRAAVPMTDDPVDRTRAITKLIQADMMMRQPKG